MFGRSPRIRRDDERGVVLILVAVAMVVILIIAAMAVDLGAKRSDRRSDQAVADLASLSAGTFLAGSGGATVVSDAFAACQSAVQSARTNVPAFSPSQDPATECAVFPVDTKTGCSAATLPQEAVFTDSVYTLVVRFPIPDAELTDARFTGGQGVADGSNQCERMRVTFGRTSQTAFARIMGVNEQSTEASSVVRASTAQLGQGVAAMLMLERLGCGSLVNSGQAEVIVRAPTATNPGVIQADSAGQVPPCSTNTNAGGFVIYGTSLPASAGSGPSIVAETSGNGTPGIIGVYALGLATPGRGAAVFPGGLSTQPVRASISSRQPVDDKYNNGGSGGGISTLHSTAWERTGWTDLTATNNGYTVISGTQECRGDIPSEKLTAQRLFVSCNSFEPAVNLFPLATDFLARGEVNIKNTAVLSLPAVQRFYVRGCGSCGGNGTGLAVSGQLLVNTGETTLAAPVPYADGVPCSTRRGPGAGGSTTNWTSLAVLSGPVSISGQARLCQTSIYMAGNTSSYTRQTVTTTGTGTENYPALTRCSATLPCPKDGFNTSAPFAVTGGGSATDWSAPNQLSGQPEAADLITYPVEDLALWSETSSGGVAMKGQAGSQSEGVFFLPNASASFTGQGTQPIELNAQYLIRRLDMNGQGRITLSPDPTDSVITPIPGAVGLIR